MYPTAPIFDARPLAKKSLCCVKYVGSSSPITPGVASGAVSFFLAIFDSCLVDFGQALPGALTPCKAVFYSAEALSDFFFISKRFAGTTNPAFSAIA
jgi:hypothetical protein